MAQLLRQDRPPADVMGRMADQDARRGAYEPCPCGSGRKFRFCHGTREAPPLPRNAAPVESATEVGA
jgi:uncharacterized protein